MTEPSETDGTEAVSGGKSPWPGGIRAITLFVEDLDATRRFYLEVFGLPVVAEDDASTVFQFENPMDNLLKASEASELIHPAAVALPVAAARGSKSSGEGT